MKKKPSIEPGGICERTDYGCHVTLRCRKHPEKQWNTKNIGIGERTLYYNLFGDTTMGPECDCPITELYHDHKDDCDHPKEHWYYRDKQSGNPNLDDKTFCGDCSHTIGKGNLVKKEKKRA